MNFVDSPFASLPLGNYSSLAVTGSLRFEGGVIHWHPRRCGPTSLPRLLRLLSVVVSFFGLHWLSTVREDLNCQIWSGGVPVYAVYKGRDHDTLIQCKVLQSLVMVSDCGKSCQNMFRGGVLDAGQHRPIWLGYIEI